jgi:hypothetical protein
MRSIEDDAVNQVSRVVVLVIVEQRASDASILCDTRAQLLQHPRQTPPSAPASTIVLPLTSTV